jgi:NAD(P)-dependent dehydrogenase (short-subunit alcohol dehydrogenase family)
MRLDGKIAVVTGAASGIGLAIADQRHAKIAAPHTVTKRRD